MEDLYEAVAEALCEGFRNGRSHAEQAAELGIPQRTVAAIVLGERRVGHKTMRAVMTAKPGWLGEVVCRAVGCGWSGSRRRRWRLQEDGDGGGVG